MFGGNEEYFIFSKCYDYLRSDHIYPDAIYIENNNVINEHYVKFIYEEPFEDYSDYIFWVSHREDGPAFIGYSI